MKLRMRLKCLKWNILRRWQQKNYKGNPNNDMKPSTYWTDRPYV